MTTRPDISRFTLTQKSGRVAQFVTDAQLKCGSILPHRLEPHPDTPGWCSPMIDGAFSCFCYYVLNLLSWPRRKSRRITFKSGNFSPLMGIPSARPALNAPEECVRKETTCFGGTVYKSSLTKRIDPLEPKRRNCTSSADAFRVSERARRIRHLVQNQKPTPGTLSKFIFAGPD